MTTSFWMTLPADGTYALVEGADLRDRLAPFGWQVTTEPGPDSFVWLRCEGIETPARLPYAALPYWRAKGWAPAAPDAPVDPTKDPVVGEPKSTASGKTATAEKNPKE